jgi:hypothetical protein
VFTIRNRGDCRTVATMSATAVPPIWFPLIRQGTHGQAAYTRLVVRGESDLDKVKEVLENFRVSLHAGLPIVVDATLESHLTFGDLHWVRPCVVVMESLGGDVVESCRVSRFSPLGELVEVIENVVLSMRSYPCSYVRIYRPHHTVLGLFDGSFQSLCLAITCR